MTRRTKSPSYNRTLTLLCPAHQRGHSIVSFFQSTDAILANDTSKAKVQNIADNGRIIYIPDDEVEITLEKLTQPLCHWEGIVNLGSRTESGISLAKNIQLFPAQSASGWLRIVPMVRKLFSATSRRAAWEVEHRLKIKHIVVHGVDTGLPNTRNFKILYL